MLQTPPTPSILGVLDGPPRHRSDSYGFGEFSKALFQDGLADRRISDPESVGSLDEQAVEAMLGTLEASDTPLPISESRPAPILSAITPSSPTTTDDLPQLTPTLQDELAVDMREPSDGQGKGKGKGRARSAVRSKLQRSKSSLKEVFKIGSTSASLESGPIDSARQGEETETIEERRRPRLRAILSFSNSRASSAASIRTQRTAASTISVRDPAIEPQIEAGAAPTAPVANVAARDSIIPAPSRSRASSMTNGQPANEEVPANEADHLGHLMISPRSHRRVRPMPKSALSTSRVSQYPKPAPPMTRSATAPVLAEGSFRKVATWQEQRKTDLFNEMLPRELKVMVLKTTLDMGSEEEREAKWDGEVGARRELIRLSRVSLQISRWKQDVPAELLRSRRAGKPYASTVNYGQWLISHPMYRNYTQKCSDASSTTRDHSSRPYRSEGWTR